MSMVISALLLLMVLALVMALSRRFHALRPIVQSLILLGTALLFAVYITFEFFVYTHDLWERFVRATAGIPKWLVAAFFVACVWVLFLLLRFMARFRRDEIVRFWKENIAPHVEEMGRNLRRGVVGTWFSFRRGKRDDEEPRTPE